MENRTKQRIEHAIKGKLLLLLKEFLISSPATKHLIAESIDDYCSNMLVRHEQNLCDDTTSILEGFLDFHHWGNQEIAPSYNLQDIEMIYQRLANDRKASLCRPL